MTKPMKLNESSSHILIYFCVIYMLKNYYNSIIGFKMQSYTNRCDIVRLICTIRLME
jgi:hypothetical protein